MMAQTTSSALTPRQANLLGVFVICALGFVAYANTLGGAFVWDDASSVLLHKTVQNPSQFLRLFQEDQHAYGRGQGAFYRPLVAASFMLDFALAYDGPRPVEGVPAVSPLIFHVTSIGWHVAAALLLFTLLGRLGAPELVRVVAAAVYVVHPLHTEAVAYISGRADSMAATFMFAGLVFSTWDETIRRRAVGIALSMLCFAAGLLSKESAAIFPALALLCAFARRSPSVEGDAQTLVSRATPVIASLIVLVAYVALKRAFLDFESDSVARSIGFGTQVIEIFQAFALYIGLFAVPIGLHMERSLDAVPFAVTIVGFLALLACIGVGVWAGMRGRRRVAIGLAWFVVTWLPISGLYPLNAPMAEHWMYVPLAGLLWALTELAVPMLRAPLALRVAGAFVFIWCAALLSMTVARNYDWRNDESLFRATLEKNPGSLRVRHNLAVVYEDLTRNRIGAEREFSRVLEQYEALTTNAPDAAASVVDIALESRLSLAGLYFGRGELERAAAQFQKVAAEPLNERTSPYIAEAAFGMGQLYLATGNRERAVAEFERARQLRPEFQPLIERLLLGRAAPGSA